MKLERVGFQQKMSSGALRLKKAEKRYGKYNIMFSSSGKLLLKVAEM